MSVASACGNSLCMTTNKTSAKDDSIADSNLAGNHRMVLAPPESGTKERLPVDLASDAG